MYLRFRISVIFNRYVQVATVITDTLLMHFLVFLLPAEAFTEAHYWIFVVAIIPIVLACMWLIDRQYREEWVISNLH